MDLFSDGRIFISLSYIASALLIAALILHTIWKGRSAEKKISELTRQKELIDASEPEKRSI